MVNASGACVGSDCAAFATGLGRALHGMTCACFSTLPAGLGNHFAGRVGGAGQGMSLSVVRGLHKRQSAMSPPAFGTLSCPTSGRTCAAAAGQAVPTRPPSWAIPHAEGPELHGQSDAPSPASHMSMSDRTQLPGVFAGVGAHTDRGFLFCVFDAGEWSPSCTVRSGLSVGE